MSGVRVEDTGGREGGQVMIHWTHNGPSVQPLADRPPPRSPEEEDEADDDDDELLVPAPPRERLSYTRYQLELLNGIFLAVRYPNSVQKQLIAKRVGISREQVKIWFQNRRRKDVVTSKSSNSAAPDNNGSPSSTHSPPSPPTSVSSASSGDCGKVDMTSQDSHDVKTNGDVNSQTDEQKEECKPKMVPDAVINGCISELKKFSDEKLKERKEKRKAKGKRRANTSSSSAHSSLQGKTSSSAQPTSRLFQSYDMVAPPNKVTPTAAFLDTSANRFNHCHNSSAFSSPRDHVTVSTSLPRSAWDGLEAGSYGGLGSVGLGMGLVNSSQTQNGGLGVSGPQDSLPVLSDLLSYRPHMDSAGSSHDNRESALPQASMLPSNSPNRDKLLELPPIASNGLPPPTSPFSLNRVYPYPFIADPPIMLSSLHQHDPLHHWAHPHSHPAPPPPPLPPHFGSMAGMGGMDPYKSVQISSLSNPYFSTQPPPPPPPSHWTAQSDTDPGLGTTFTQL